MTSDEVFEFLAEHGKGEFIVDETGNIRSIDNGGYSVCPLAFVCRQRGLKAWNGDTVDNESAFTKILGISEPLESEIIAAADDMAGYNKAARAKLFEVLGLKTV